MSHNINTTKKIKERGIIKYVIYLFILILVLSYFGFSIKDFMNQDMTQNNLGYVLNYVFEIWDSYLKPVYDFLTDLFAPYINDTLDRLRNHEDFIMPNVPTNVVPSIN